MAIESRTLLGSKQTVVSKRDVEPAGAAGSSRQERNREQSKRRRFEADRQPTSNTQDPVIGKLIDVTV